MLRNEVKCTRRRVFNLVNLVNPVYLRRRVHERCSPSRDENVGAISVSRDEVGRTQKKVQPTHEGYLRGDKLY